MRKAKSTGGASRESVSIMVTASFSLSSTLASNIKPVFNTEVIKVFCNQQLCKTSGHMMCIHIVIGQYYGIQAAKARYSKASSAPGEATFWSFLPVLLKLDVF